MKLNKTMSSAFTLTGTIIGAGILGLPFVFGKSGFFVGAFWVLSLGFVMGLTYFYLMEVSLRTKGKHQLTGLAKKYLGKKGEYLMIFAMMFGIYASLLAYLVGEGESLSQLFFGNTNYSLYFTLAFWIVLTLLLEGGLERLKSVETFGVIAIIIIIVIVFFMFIPKVSFSNITSFDKSNFFIPFGVTLFALLGFAALPEVREEMRGSEKLLKKTILIGILIPIILYLLFTFSFVGVLGPGISEIATLSFGPIMILLGIFTMLTSYFVLSFSIKDMCKLDFNMKRHKTFFFSSLFPLIFYLILYLLNESSFILILGIGGVVSGGLTGILAILMNYYAKKKGNRKPEFSVYINKLIILTLSVIFVMGVVIEIYKLIV